MQERARCVGLTVAVKPRRSVLTRSVLAHADLTRWSAYDWTRLGGNPGMPTMMAATVLAIEGLPFVSVHVQDREIPSIIMSGVLGLVMAFIAHGRMPRTAIR